MLRNSFKFGDNASDDQLVIIKFALLKISELLLDKPRRYTPALPNASLISLLLFMIIHTENFFYFTRYAPVESEPVTIYTKEVQNI